jgi:long-subunit acyl-CoA synthetase (AMP-forming)
MVLEAQSPTVIQFWETLLPTQNAEQPCLQQWQAGTYRPTSFKDIHAQAHCVAGYLMRRGIGKGDAIGIIAKPGLRYHVLHIALQYLGVINVTFPPDCKTDEVEQLAFKYNFKMLFVEAVDQFLAHGEFKDLKAGLLGVIIGEDDVDALEPEKIVTFDRVVTIGKSAWREEAGTLKAHKAAVAPASIYAVLVESGGKITTLTMEQWMAAVAAAEQLLTAAAAKSLLSTLGPDRLLWRSFSFAAVHKRVLWWIRPGNDFDAANLPTVKPEVILMNAEDARVLYDLLPTFIDTAEKGRKAITAGIDVVRKRDIARAEGKKDKFMNRLRYRFTNRKLYGRIKTKLGGHLVTLACDKGLVDADARLLLEECGFVIQQ